jgi:hypothetical protein
MEPRGYLALGLVSFGAIGCTAIASLFPGRPFQRYLGGINPLLAVVLVAVAGVVSLGLLQSRGWFAIVSPGPSRRGLAVAAAFATLFAVIVVPADLLIRFPRDLNVPLPQSLFFYPAIGYVAEIAFHALPLAMLLLLLGPIWKEESPNSLVWLCIIVASALEPILQVSLSSSGGSFSVADGFVALHVFAFNAAQLYVFRRYDFVSMYATRLVYYLYWHIIWGALRLHWLF